MTYKDKAELDLERQIHPHLTKFKDESQSVTLYFILPFPFYLPLILEVERKRASDGEPFNSGKRILIHISQGFDSILILIKHFFVLRISKTSAFS